MARAETGSEAEQPQGESIFTRQRQVWADTGFEMRRPPVTSTVGRRVWARTRRFTAGRHGTRVERRVPPAASVTVAGVMASVVRIEDFDGGELHVALHVVPRWAAGSNFMALTGETRVLPPSLTDTYATFRPWLA